jgi:hypothetical protein
VKQEEQKGGILPKPVLSSRLVRNQPNATPQWFRHIAQRMVTLAEKLSQHNQCPTKPAGIPDNLGSIPHLPNLQEAPETPPSRHRNMQAPSTPSRATPGTVQQPPDVEEHGICSPTTFGHFKKFDYTNRKTHATVMMRVLVHGAVQANMVEFEWVNPKKLKYQIAWPEFFQFPEQMANFCTDEDGNVMYGREHPLTIDFAERHAKITEEDGKIYDTGFFRFDQAMKTEVGELVFDLLDFNIESQNVMVKMLQGRSRSVGRRGGHKSIAQQIKATNKLTLFVCTLLQPWK